MRVLAALMLALVATEAVQERRPAVENVKGLGFFKRFGSSLNRNKVHTGMLDCDFDHPEKQGFCPPVEITRPFPDKKELSEEEKQE